VLRAADQRSNSELLQEIFSGLNGDELALLARVGAAMQDALQLEAHGPAQAAPARNNFLVGVGLLLCLGDLGACCDSTLLWLELPSVTHLASAVWPGTGPQQGPDCATWWVT
jgi:hypothetical protein